MKDNFSTQSELYARYRPQYPKEFFDYLDIIITSKDNAWDCGTGNGQVATELAKRFMSVYATDISEAQLAEAQQLPNVIYSVQAAEKTNFPNDSFDLITVAQAIHWFDFEKFYAEIKRTAKPSATLVVMGYGRVEVTPEIDRVINDFYKNTIGNYWEKSANTLMNFIKPFLFLLKKLKHLLFLFHIIGP